MMFNFSIKESLNELKSKNYDISINNNIDYLNIFEDYQLKLLANSDGIKLNNLIRLFFTDNIGFRCINLQQEKYGKIPICRNIENFLNEKYQESLTGTDNIIEFLKSDLIDWNDNENWEKFIDNQELGDCQSIIYHIEDITKTHNLPIESHFGEIELDEDFYNVNDNEYIDRFTHHWIEINGKIFEFSKGTLKNYIDFDDIYSVESENDNIYHQIK